MSQEAVEQAVPSAVPPDGAPPPASYTAEIRFGVVMYGGVSLAIYINGVSNELFEMACATPCEGVDIDDPPQPSTRDIYRRVSWLIGSPDLRERYAEAICKAPADVDGCKPDVWPVLQQRLGSDGSTQTRLVVDVIAGTSAGGINGVFLAKALANGQQFGALKDLWVNEGDIALLLNDAPSYLDTDPRIVNRSAKPTSLLNSDRMYAKLHYALRSMAPLPGVRGQAAGSSPLVDEIDLFVTTTDIKGSAVPLRLFDKVVHERRYKQSYHFCYPNGCALKGVTGRNDFAEVNVPFLAFASRCTSSFPFAFEPMMLSALDRLNVAGPAPGVRRWDAFFTNLSRSEVELGRHVDRAFGDGGYLDNKPFSYVVDMLSSRFAGVPMERKLLYVEPAPERLHPDDPNLRPDANGTPDALENSLDALLTIPRQETIREDLQAVLARNRRIERIERVVRLTESNIRVSDPFTGVVLREGAIPDWAGLSVGEMARYYGTAFLPYQRLRVSATTDALAARLASCCGIDEGSDQLYALRALVQVWREENYDDDGNTGMKTLNAFLDEFDFDYRVRRLGFLLRRVDRLTRLFSRRAAWDPTRDGSFVGQSDEERHLLRELPPPFTGLPDELDRQQVRRAEQVLRALKFGLLNSRRALLDARRDIGCPRRDGQELDQLRRDLYTVLSLILGENPPDGQAAVHAQGGAGTMRVILDAEAVHAASASRTLNEAVVLRAKALFKAAEGAPKTPLQDWLLAGIEGLRFKKSRAAPAQEELAVSQAAGLAWELLGCPRLVVQQHGAATRVDTQVGPVRAAAFGVALPAGLLAQLNTPDGTVLRLFLGMHYLRFDTFDQISFPLYFDTGTGEPAVVEVVRVSPVDATNLIDEATDPQRRRKLAGTALANFGAFLDRRWRLNDIMWGRLDAAERLVQALLPMKDKDTEVIRSELIERAQGSILRDALVPEGHAQITGLMVQALAATGPSSKPVEQQLQDLLQRLALGDQRQRAQLASVLTSLLSDRALMTYVSTSRQVSAEPDAEATLKSAARAVTITGRVLESISTSRGAGKAVPRWLARLGLLMQGLVAVSLPGTLNQRWWTHGVKLLYAFEVLLLVLALVLGSADMRTLAITAFASTVGVHVLTLILGDIARNRSSPALHGLLIAVGTALLTLALIGAVGLARVGWQQLLCPSQAGAKASASVPDSWLCRQPARD